MSVAPGDAPPAAVLKGGRGEAQRWLNPAARRRRRRRRRSPWLRLHRALSLTPLLDPRLASSLGLDVAVVAPSQFGSKEEASGGRTDTCCREETTAEERRGSLLLPGGGRRLPLTSLPPPGRTSRHPCARFPTAMVLTRCRIPTMASTRHGLYYKE
jgi:hypothetical protein